MICSALLLFRSPDITAYGIVPLALRMLQLLSVPDDDQIDFIVSVPQITPQTAPSTSGKWGS